jgi:hypothetical protein
MRSTSVDELSRWVLRLDGAFLALTGAAALVSETAGYLWGIGPLGRLFGVPQTVGEFEAHGLAIIFGILFVRGAARIERHAWHAIGLAVHLLVGTSNLLFWPVFRQMDLMTVGWVTTTLHVLFASLHAACLQRAGQTLARREALSVERAG